MGNMNYILIQNFMIEKEEIRICILLEKNEDHRFYIIFIIQQVMVLFSYSLNYFKNSYSHFTYNIRKRFVGRDIL